MVSNKWSIFISQAGNLVKYSLSVRTKAQIDSENLNSTPLKFSCLFEKFAVRMLDNDNWKFAIFHL